MLSMKIEDASRRLSQDSESQWKGRWLGKSSSFLRAISRPGTALKMNLNLFIQSIHPNFIALPSNFFFQFTRTPRGSRCFLGSQSSYFLSYSYASDIFLEAQAGFPSNLTPELPQKTLFFPGTVYFLGTGFQGQTQSSGAQKSVTRAVLMMQHAQQSFLGLIQTMSISKVVFLERSLRPMVIVSPACRHVKFLSSFSSSALGLGKLMNQVLWGLNFTKLPFGMSVIRVMFTFCPSKSYNCLNIQEGRQHMPQSATNYKTPQQVCLPIIGFWMQKIMTPLRCRLKVFCSMEEGSRILSPQSMFYLPQKTEGQAVSDSKRTGADLLPPIPQRGFENMILIKQCAALARLYNALILFLMSVKVKEFDLLYKLVIIGKSAVGKSAVMLKFVSGEFNEKYLTTIGVDFRFKTILKGGKRVKLQIWDTAGQERFNCITNTYYKSANAIYLVYDISSKQSFNELQNYWLEQVRRYAQSESLLVLLGNKSDLQSTRQVSKEEAELFAKSNQMMFFESSAKDGQGVREVFEQVVERLMNINQKGKVQSQKLQQAPIKKKGCEC